MTKLLKRIIEESPTPLCKKLIDNLVNTKFVTDPASYKYHHVYVGGLMTHSYEVYNELKKLVKENNLEFTDEVLFLIAFGHDLDKIGSYWYNEDGTYGFKFFSRGGRTHGENSLFKLEKILGDELKNLPDYNTIAICIKGHMADYDRMKKAKKFYHDNVQTCPLLWLTSQADLHSCDLQGQEYKDLLVEE